MRTFINFYGILVFVTACHSIRITTPPLTTTPVPMTSTVTLPRISPIIIHQGPPEPTPPVCMDAVSANTPLGRLRSAMKNTSYTQMNAYFDAFIVFFSDEHLSEEPSPEERRLQYVSGWDGPGTAVVLAEGGAAIWVPGSELKQARMMLSCAWLVLNADDINQPSIAEWISDRLRRNGRVGADARLTSFDEWQTLSGDLLNLGLQLVQAPTFVDQLWLEEPNPALRRPEFSRIVANLHSAEYTGLTWRDKVAFVRSELKNLGADAMVVTALDEVAWLLNVRGRDLPHSPLLKAFVIIGNRDVRVYVPPGKLSITVRDALAVFNCLPNTNCTRVLDYTLIYTDLRRATEMKILIPSRGTFQRGASFAIAQSIAQSKRLFQTSPIIYLKAMKNEAEAKGMRRAHLRDAVAMCTLLNYLESMVKSGLTEKSVAMKVDETRATQAAYIGVSMKTRVAFGPNAAEPSYRPTNMTNRRIFGNSTVVVESGGQYQEGTTVVTRTLHYGNPSRDEKRAYTTVLRSLSALATLQTPATLPAAHVDPVCRAPLWAAKQDYPQPSGHGVGAALNRVEDPVVIDYRQDANLHTFREGYFITSQPGWYENGRFGIRLGNILEVMNRPTGFLWFREATLVPYEPKLIDQTLLTEYEINWLNQYNDRIRKVVGPELRDQGLTDVYYWMMNKTKHIDPPSKMKKNMGSDAPALAMNSITVICVLAYTYNYIIF